MRYESSPSRRKRNPNSTTVILGLALLALALGLCGLLAAVNVISKVTNPIAVDPSPPGISDPSNSPTA
ncbi:MAG: hypothetical protein MUP11_03130, partial [Anaerolineales bacterium]|nr:hypothetical protein [Anaerolineales bacterium]